MKRARDFRQYIDVLKSLGEIQEIDWNLEMGAITRRSYELRTAAPLFNKIKGYPAGFRALGAPIGLSANAKYPYARIAVSVGLEPEADILEIIETMSTWEKMSQRQPFNVVPDGKCKQNKMLGDEVDLLSFPSPLIHVGDGGRYFGTIGILITQTPDQKWTNWSVNRCMVQGKNKLNLNIPGGILSSKHAGMIQAEWHKIGKPIPVAFVQGVEPLAVMISGMPLPDNVSEGELLGAYVGEPLDMVRCETIDLEVPADAEIVIEGFVGNGDCAMEGLMGEYSGFLVPGSSQEKPLMTITGITYRDNPILPVCAAGEPAEENHTCWAVAIAASILGELWKQDFPVKTCFIPFESAVQWLVVLIDSSWTLPADDIDGTEFCTSLGRAIFSTRGGINTPKAIIVRDDIDPTNLAELVWAFATRCHSDIGEIHLPDLRHNSLEACLHTDETKTPLAPKTVYNCLFSGRSPGAHATRSSFKYNYPKELQDKILSNWKSYGYRN